MTRFLLLILAVTLNAFPVRAGEAEAAFKAGLESYRDARFPEAAGQFEKAARLQPSAGALVNFGLAEWQRGRAGSAILAWEQALWLDPHNQPARQNLELARLTTQVDEPALKWHERLSSWLPPNAWVWLAGAFLWLAVAALILPRLARRPLTGWQQWLAALAFGSFLVCLAANYGVVSRTSLGFVLRKSTPLLLVPAKTSETITTLAAGEPARSLKRRGNYLFVQTSSGSGWVDEKDLGLINRP